MASSISGQLQMPSTFFMIASALFRASNAQEGTDCPDGSGFDYSPFKPYFAYSYPRGDDLRCWRWITCVLTSSDEARKQQYAATALVMGVLPLTLGDFPWKRDNAILVSRHLPLPLDVLVRALGVRPKNNPEKARGLKLSNYAGKPMKTRFAVAGLTTGLLLGYAAVALLEIYSKRSALGCPYPVFVVSWWVLALVPATIESVYIRFKEKPESLHLTHTRAKRDAFGGDTESIGSSLLSFIWAIYGIAGTLIYTSITAVFVAELFAWVVISILLAGFSKALGFFLCALVEKQVPDDPSRSAGRNTKEAAVADLQVRPEILS